MSNHDPIPLQEPLLLPALIKAHLGNAVGDGTISRIIEGLLSSPMTDAERAGERLRVFGWQVGDDPRTLQWCYRVVGEDTGRDLLQFNLAVPGGSSELPCRVLGLQLQIMLNGVDETEAHELDAFMELAEEARRQA